MKLLRFALIFTTAAALECEAQISLGEFHIIGPTPPISPHPLTLSVETPDASSENFVGGKFVRFGTAELHTPAVERTLLLRSHFPRSLVRPQLVIEGPHAADFSAETGDLIPANGTLPLKVRFQPSDVGPREASLKIMLGQTVHVTLDLGGTGANGAAASLRYEPAPDWVGTALLKLPDGSTLIAGYTRGHMRTSCYLRRIDHKGADSSFHIQSANGPIHAIAACSDGTFLVAGEFTAFGDLPRQGVARLTVHGASHVDFNPPSGDFAARALVALPDGKVLVGGSGQLGGRSNLIRLNKDGSLDQTFTLLEPNSTVNALALQQDGKVVVGGDFTNLGQQGGGWGVPPFVITNVFRPISWPIYRTDYSGLFRLDAQGSVDPMFWNGSFSRVTALDVRGDRIAVAGQVRVTPHYPYYIIPIMPPYPWLRSKVALITDTGWEMRSRYVDNEPTAVAISPGNRILYAPGDGSTGNAGWWSSPTVSHLDASGDGELHGLKMLPIVEAWPGSGVPFTTGTRYQKLDGPVHALLAQADGKTLVAGDFKTASIEEHQITAQVPGGLDIPKNITSGALPPPQTAAGFVQLDTDGYVKTHTALKGSDGLQNIDLCYNCAYIWSPPWYGFSGPAKATDGTPITYTWTIDGPDAADFVVQPSTGPQTPWNTIAFPITFPQQPPPPQISYFEISVRPSRAGLLKAKLHVRISGYDEPFDIGLSSHVSSSLYVEVSAGGRKWYDSGEAIDFGLIETGKPKAIALDLKNRFSFFNTGNFALEVQGTGFSTAQTGVYLLNAGESIPVTIDFAPQTSGAFTGKLILTPQDGGLPFEVLLSGSAALPPSLQSQAGARLVEAGEPLQLGITSQSSLRAQVQWYHNGLPIYDGVLETLHRPSIGLEDAGSYECKVNNSLGGASVSYEVAVVKVQNRIVFGTPGKPMELVAEAAGAGLTYLWRKNGVVVKNVKTPRLPLPKFTAADAGVYECEVRLGTEKMSAGSIRVSRLPAPVITPPPSLTGSVGQSLQLALEAENGPFTWRSSGLPRGLTLHSTTGVISGEPRQAGRYNVRVTATNTSGSATASLVIHITPLPAESLGTFDGLIPRNDLFTQGLGGHLSLVITSTGSFTGRLISHQNWPVSGLFIRNGNSLTASVQHPISGTVLNLIKPIGGSDATVLHATLTSENTIQSFTLHRRALSALASSAQLQLVPVPLSSFQISGTLQLRQSATGSAILSGQLTWPGEKPRSVLLSTYQLQNGHLPFFRLLHIPTDSSLQGQLTTPSQGQGDWGTQSEVVSFNVVPSR